MISKVKLITAHEKKMKDTWVCRCLNIRENMLSYFAAMEPINFAQSTFPLSPAFDAIRLHGVETLVARDLELLKTLKTTNSIITENARELSKLYVEVENLQVKIRKVSSDISKLERVQHSQPIFLSGESVMHAGAITSSFLVSLNAPLAKNRIVCCTHNCELVHSSDPTQEICTREVTVTPSWIKQMVAEADHVQWEWFAHMYLEYDGKQANAQELGSAGTLLQNLNEQLEMARAKAISLSEQMKTISPESKTIHESLREMHLLREFLQKESYLLPELAAIVAAFPFEDYGKLSAIMQTMNS